MGFKDANYWKLIKDKKLKCFLCPHECIIENGEVGKCKTRMNILGKLKIMNYSKVYEISHNKIEENNLFHFLPNSQTIKVLVPGTNLKNKIEFSENLPVVNLTPGALVKQTNKTNSKIIFYSGEPGIYIEYIKDVIKKAGDKRQVIESSGFLNEVLIKDLKEIEAGLFEINSMREEFYEKLLDGKLENVLNFIKEFYKKGKLVEIKMPLIKEFHEDFYDVRKLVSWILKELDKNVPLHFLSINVSEDFLEKCRKIAMDAGMDFVYTLNEKNTFCPNCKKPVVIRGEEIVSKIKQGKCVCGQEIFGIWK
jgi:pyruvate formate lyase activating enzyme